MLRTIRSVSLFWVFVLTALSASAEIQPVRYVFLFIGDGMSLPQIQLAEEFVRQTENRGLQISSMPYRAITTTHAIGDLFITDSAAAGTAIASGIKTNNRALGVDSEGKPHESIAEHALKNGRKVGIISSTTINHATPAAFYAHVANRNREYEIGLNLVESGFHYFGGGSIAGYNDRNAAQYRGNIYDLAKEAGYTLCRTLEEIRSLTPGTEKVLALGSAGALPYAIDGNREGRRLVDFTRQAIELLDNPNGFFMMVEGGNIDPACHDNDAATAVWEMIEFDEAVNAAFDFAEKKPGEVLIVVTGDHETGGLSVRGPETGYRVYLSLLLNQKASKGTLVTLTEQFVKDNKENASFEQFKRFITEQSGLVFSEEGQWQPGTLHLTKNEMKELEEDFALSKKRIEENRSGKDKVVRTVLRLLNTKSGVTWSTTEHTGLPVCTSTWGNQADRIALGIRDNTDIAKQLKATVGTLP